MKHRLPTEVGPYMVAVAAAIVVIAFLPGSMGVVPRIVLFSIAGVILVIKSWPWA